MSVFVILALFMIATTYYGTRIQSALHAYIGAERQWTQAQKAAVGLLYQYVSKEEHGLYEQYREMLELHEAFQHTRVTLSSDDPDHALAVRGFQTADLHPDDIELLVWITQFGPRVPGFERYLERSFEIWEEADRGIAELRNLADAAREAVRAGRMDEELRDEFVREIAELDSELTDLETAFSATMAERARRTRNALFWFIVGSGATLILTGYIITTIHFRKLNRLNRKLLESEAKFRRVLLHSRDVVYELSLHSRTYEYVSPAVEELLGYSAEQVLTWGPSFIQDQVHPDDREYVEDELAKLDHFSSDLVYRIRTKRGNFIWVQNQRKLVHGDDGKPVAIVGTVRDISAAKEREEQLRRSVDEKRTLLAEVHHRVKNNLAVISGLLALQKSETSGETHHILQDTESRIRSIATIHEKLYQTDTFSEVDMKMYIDDFARYVAYSYSSRDKSITIKQNVERIYLDITRAVPLGLIINELLNNAYKHGIAEAESGEIVISLEGDGDKYVLRVANSGMRLPADFSFENVDSLGMTLIRNLTLQLQGEFDVDKSEATTFRITFPAG